MVVKALVQYMLVLVQGALAVPAALREVVLIHTAVEEEVAVDMALQEATGPLALEALAEVAQVLADQEMVGLPLAQTRAVPVELAAV